jgi:ABC-type enterochelin transport system permease subunit
MVPLAVSGKIVLVVAIVGALVFLWMVLRLDRGSDDD